MVHCRGTKLVQQLVTVTMEDPFMTTWNLPSTTTSPSARFRLMAVDLDSIVTPAGVLNPLDAGALRAAHAVGVKVVLASALSPQAIHRYWAQLGLGAPVIAFDGALIYDFPTQKAQLDQPLDRDALAQLLQHVRRIAPKAPIVLERADTWTANRIGSQVRSAIQQTGLWPQISADLSAYLDRPVYRATVEASGTILDALQAELPAAGLASSRSTDPGILTLRSSTASREWALSALAGLQDVSLDEVVAISGGSSDGARLDAGALALLMTNAVAGAGLLASEPSSEATYGDGGDLPDELTPEGSDDLWPTIER